MNKKQLRAEYRALRRSVPDKEQKSRRIRKKLQNAPYYRQAAVIAAYASLPDEVGTDVIITEALQSGKRVCLPKIMNHQMHFYEIDRETVLKPGVFGIREPESDKEVPPEAIDLVLVPLIAADSDKYRLGFGGGYYDRFLQGFGGISAGLAFSRQITPFLLPREAHDVPLNTIITDE